jgi:hypothetical protein
MSAARMSPRQASLLLALLAAAAAGLGILSLADRGRAVPYTGLGEVPAPTREAVEQAVADMFATHGIAPGDVRTWRVSSPARQEFRVEQRVRVAPDFVSIEFNRALGSLLAPHDVRVAATERTRERTVTMHLVLNGAVIRTITFVMDPDLAR